MQNKRYYFSEELLNLALELRERYYVHLGHVLIDRIFFAMIEGEKPAKAKVITLSGVKADWLKELLKGVGKVYCIAAWASDWYQLSYEKQQWEMYNLLRSIHPDNDGKINKPDTVGWSEVLAYLGPYWEEAEELPSLLADEPLKLMVPKNNTDEGATTDYED